MTNDEKLHESAGVQDRKQRFSLIAFLRVDTITSMIWKSVLVFIILSILDRVILGTFFDMSMLDLLYELFPFLEDFVVYVQSFLTFERSMMALMVFILTFVVTWWVLPNLPSVKLFFTNIEKSLIDDEFDIPITHRVGLEYFSGKRRIVYDGERPKFVTKSFSGEQRLLAKSYTISNEEIRVKLADSHNWDDLTVLAVCKAKDRFGVDYWNVQKENIFWRNFFSLNATAVGINAFKYIKEKQDPTFGSSVPMLGLEIVKTQFDQMNEIKEDISLDKQQRTGIDETTSDVSSGSGK